MLQASFFPSAQVLKPYKWGLQTVCEVIFMAEKKDMELTDAFKADSS